MKDNLIKLKKIFQRNHKVCPGCSKSNVDTSQLKRLLSEYFSQQADLFEFVFKGDLENAYLFYTSLDSHWACDACLDNGIALAAKIEKQTYSIWQPYMAYINQDRTCRTCNVSFVFSKYEQQYWYEVLKFWVVSEAVNCKECRKKKRNRKEQIFQAQKEIENFLPVFDKTNANHLEKVIQLYELTESHKVVSFYKQQLEKMKKSLSD